MAGQEDWFEEFERVTPEAKLELIEGRLIIGNSEAGSRYYLHDLLSGWGADAALAFAAPEAWRSALHEAFAALTPPETTAPLEAWRAWADALNYEPHLAPAGPMNSGSHHRARQVLQTSVFRACGMGRFGASLGHDFVMHIGAHGFTPDGMLIGRQATERLFERYLQGPADLVWEIVLPGHRQEREFKFRAYEAGGVPHYIIVDPQSQVVDCFDLVGGAYWRTMPGSDGRYRTRSAPGLAFVPGRLWEPPNDREAQVFEVEKPLPAGWTYKAQKGLDWDDVPFSPAPTLAPGRIAFEEFAAWCPRAKFEGDGERTVIGGRLGTRNVLGMLLRTFGLIGTVAVMHPREWIAGLAAVEQGRKGDAERKARWWDLARRVAAVLRDRRGVRRIAVIGPLTRPEPLDFWSELQLVAWDLPGGTFDLYDLLCEVDPECVVDLVRAERASESEKQLIDNEAMEIP